MRTKRKLYDYNLKKMAELAQSDALIMSCNQQKEIVAQPTERRGKTDKARIARYLFENEELKSREAEIVAFIWYVIPASVISIIILIIVFMGGLK